MVDERIPFTILVLVLLTPASFAQFTDNFEDMTDIESANNLTIEEGEVRLSPDIKIQDASFEVFTGYWNVTTNKNCSVVYDCAMAYQLSFHPSDGAHSLFTYLYASGSSRVLSGSYAGAHQNLTFEGKGYFLFDVHLRNWDSYSGCAKIQVKIGEDVVWEKEEPSLNEYIRLLDQKIDVSNYMGTYPLSFQVIATKNCNYDEDVVVYWDNIRSSHAPEGTLLSKPIDNPGGFFSLDYERPSGTNITFDIVDETAMSILQSNLQNGDKITIDSDSYPRIRLRASLETTDGISTPVLHSWGIGKQISDYYNQDNLISISQNLSIAYGEVKIESAGFVEYTADTNTTALLHFNEDSGNVAYDEAGGDNNGTYGSLVSHVSGRFDLGFKDADSPTSPYTQGFVEVSGASLGETPEGTIEVWVKPANEWNYSSVYKKIVDKGSGRRNRALHYENGELCFSFHISGSGGAEDYRSACYSINLSANTWYHVAGTWGSKGVKLYLDGELVNTNPNYTGYGFTTSDLFWIGRAHCCPNQYTDAVFDEFRVSDVARTSFPEHKSSGTLTSITFTTSKPIISITPGWSASNVGGEYDVDADTASLWHFNEGSGTTAYDETVNNNDGTINGANWTTNSKFWDCKFRDYALDFDGVDNNVQIPDSVSLSPSTQLTAEAWIYPRSLGSMGIISKWHPGGPSDRSYVLHLLPSGALRGVISDGVSDYHIMETPEIIPTNKWTHVALVFDAGTMRIFINGHLSAENVTAAASIFDTTLPIVIGSIYNNEQVQTGLTYDWFGFDGVIDEVRISNVARTEFPQTNRLDIHVSADGGETWCVACNSTPVTSGCGLGTGNQLRYKAIFASDGLTSPVLHDITLAYEIDTIPPQSISNLQNTTATTWINWTWENPPDSDFNYTMIYIDSSFAENVSSSYYNLTNLLPNTSHTISTRTVDTAGNINETWVNQTTFTLAEIPELSASVVSSSQIDLSWKSDNPEGTFYELFEDSELIYSGTSTFFNHTGLSSSTTYYYKLRAKNGADVYTENSSAEATTKSAIICGDGRCEGGETCSSCPSDCGRCPSGRKAYCGDGRCDSGETCSSCPDDCGVCPTPTPTPAPTPTPLPADVSVLIKKDVGSLQAGESRVVSFEESDIWEIEINVRNAVSNVSIEIQQIIGKPNVSDAPGISYRYLNITAGNLTEEDLENATIRFRVNLSWIAENEIDEGKIALQRYNETKESWTELPTERIGKENESLLYEAVSLGFSIFAITGEMKIEAPTPVPTPIPTFIPTEAILPSPTPTPPEKVPSKLILGFEVVVALLALVIVYILRGFSRS